MSPACSVDVGSECSLSPGLFARDEVNGAVGTMALSKHGLKHRNKDSRFPPLVTLFRRTKSNDGGRMETGSPARRAPEGFLDLRGAGEDWTRLLKKPISGDRRIPRSY